MSQDFRSSPGKRTTSRALLLAACGCLFSCASNPGGYAQQFERRATQGGAVRSVVQGTDFSHIVYRRATVLPGNNSTVIVYLEGDGLPSNDGVQAATDPTPQHALAFELMMRTTQPAWYVTRPCYNGLYRDAGCDNALWTRARYSTTVVNSMVAALTRYAQSQGNPHLVLVGYSGGGVLALLMAARTPNVVGIITVAANLDTDAWTALHRYSPLVESLNPADNLTDTQMQKIPEIHLLGDRDAKVPPASTARYFSAHPQAIRRQIDAYDHVCCWEKNWPTLLASALREITALSAVQP